MNVERIDPAGNLGCHLGVIRRVSDRVSSHEPCGLPSIVRLENWAGRVEYLCPEHARELLGDLTAALEAAGCPPTSDEGSEAT